jgi:hypothetical protein
MRHRLEDERAALDGDCRNEDGNDADAHRGRLPRDDVTANDGVTWVPRTPPFPSVRFP